MKKQKAEIMSAKKYRHKKTLKPLSRKALASKLTQAAGKLQTTEQALHALRQVEVRVRLQNSAMMDEVKRLNAKVTDLFKPLLEMRQCRVEFEAAMSEEMPRHEVWDVHGGFRIAMNVDIWHVRRMPMGCGRDSYQRALAEEFAKLAYRHASEALKVVME